MTGRLFLVRHGQSEWNLENRFTGWADVGLTPRGEEEARAVGEKLKSVSLQKVFTSDLKRTWLTAEIILSVIGQQDIPVERSRSLNERNYGTLQGLNKNEAARTFGEIQVKIWRRSFSEAPPRGESLRDTALRVIPFFKSRIVPEILAGLNVLVVAHGNTLRAIVMDLDRLTPAQVERLEIGTGGILVYEKSSFSRTDLPAQ